MVGRRSSRQPDWASHRNKANVSRGRALTGTLPTEISFSELLDTAASAKTSRHCFETALLRVLPENQERLAEAGQQGH